MTAAQRAGRDRRHGRRAARPEGDCRASWPRRAGRPTPSRRCAKPATLAPDDDEIREQLLDVYLAAGDFAHARECATTRRAVQDARRRARRPAATPTRRSRRCARRRGSIRPTPSSRAQLARTFVARGDLTTAAEYLTVETAGDDPQLLLTVAEIQLRGDRPTKGWRSCAGCSRRTRRAARRSRCSAGRSPSRRPTPASSVVELAADAAVARPDWPAAAAALQEFVTRVPNHVPALMRLVEICVDGGLEATMYSAQAQLADAYIAAGAATEARFIAEDLVAREPWERRTSSGSGARSCCWASPIPTRSSPSG